MSDRQTSQFSQLTQQASAGMPTEKMKLTPELVTAVSDRIYDMLLRELKVERERQRFLNRPQRK